jgi:hypothetical protein
MVGLTANVPGGRVYTLPDASGTLALTTDLGAYLPLSGGTLTGALGGTSLNFSGDIQTATRLISATGGEQILINANNGGSTNRVESVGTLPLSLVSAAAITMAAGGTTPQITLATTGAVTLTGALNGTSAVFSGNAQVSKLLLGTSTANSYRINLVANSDFDTAGILLTDTNTGGRSYAIGSSITTIGSLEFRDNTAGQNRLTISSTGAATFSSSVTALNAVFKNQGSAPNNTLFVQTSDYASGSVGSVLRLGHVATTGSTTAIIQNLTAGGTAAGNISFPEGNVGIGTASPANILHASDGSGATRIQVDNTANSAAGAGIYMRTLSGGSMVSNATLRTDNAGNLSIFTGTTSEAERMRITSAGNVGIGTASPGVSLEVNGLIRSIPIYNNTTATLANLVVSAGGTFERSTTSSGRYKDNITDWNDSGLETILSLKPKEFTYKEDYYSFPDRKFLGLIAEDVEQVSTYLVDFENEDGSGQVENVRYANIVVPLIKAIQELKTEIDSLKNQIK